MKKLGCLLFLLAIMPPSFAQQPPKREFRGTWIHTVGNKDYQNMTTEEMRQHYIDLLNKFEKAGINAVIFQIRPQADAFYITDHEPWSRFITGEQGKAPNPLWDPLEFMIEECHNRGMELHAWLNPYRVTSNDKEEICKDHLYYKKPHLFVKYGKQIYFDPGQSESREHTIKVIADVVSRYDIDAIHFDDYFYPYRVKNEEFPDEESFLKYHEADGLDKDERDDWRRNNVNILVQQLGDTIKKIKPWVKFGISPFGVWRNKSDDSTGSDSQARQTNYDDLFADVKLWVEKGWIDYNAPQLYWEIGHPLADYAPLIKWWSKNNFNEQLYIGQDVMRTINVLPQDSKDKKGESQLYEKMRMVRQDPNIHGNVWWSGYGLSQNPYGIIDSLATNYQRYPSLIPRYSHIDSIPPTPVKHLSGEIHNERVRLAWQVDSTENEMDKAFYFCIYRFEVDEPIDLDDATKIVKIVRTSHYAIPQSDKKYKYVVTALDRLQNESEASTPIIL
ncbi:MAG: family 10 glycosylhydrolase [Prevotellaceae bacterium]|jgi:uncharacterized lipoprotein YddW (UPF0748 family)|nr:family 10 glycosylhydrolase [Prevotellaceae bacterium]